MALGTTVLWADAIEMDFVAGGQRTFQVQDTSDNAIAASASGLGQVKTYRELRSGKTFKWMGKTKTAADAFVTAYAGASTDAFQISVRSYCDNHILRSYTVEYCYEAIQTILIGVADITESASDPGTPPPMEDT